jgi:hypothetical protein
MLEGTDSVSNIFYNSQIFQNLEFTTKSLLWSQKLNLIVWTRLVVTDTLKEDVF